MKVARNTTHGLRHDCLAFTDQDIDVSMRTHHNEIWIAVELDGKTTLDYWTPRQLAAVLMNASTDPHEKP